ncbi:hypothetical protein LCGC14_1860740 [marine sediment metagenome]|uniref:MmcB family DNA repair protein n=1 Tax=marine sediment metagenome TaxID=412755 RepID=A0A0F9J6P1_9ZZZZ
MTTRELHAALELRFDARRGWALLYEMSPAGYARRRVDAMAFGLWPSRGLEIHGIEIKASRSDWLVELKNPAKVEQSAFSFCDRWWIAVTDAEIVKDDELPSTWGLLIPRGSRLVAKVKAPKLTPEPINRLLLARVLHRIGDSADEGQVADLVYAAHSRGVEAGEKSAHKKMQASAQGQAMAEERLKKICSSFAAFEKAAGVRLEGWDPDRIVKLGAAAARLLRSEQVVAGARESLIQAKATLETAVAYLRSEIEAVEERKERP